MGIVVPGDPPAPEPSVEALALWWPLLEKHCASSSWDRFVKSLRANGFPPKVLEQLGEES